MAKYYVQFGIKGRIHSLVGTSTYPSKELYEKNTYDSSIAEDSAKMLIREYLRQFNFKEPIDKDSVTFQISFED